ncbi:MAG: tyrosine-type recombinase/integrase [Clostridiales bacterium]|nr:site-specific integrase [Clostridiales bacterium]MDD7347144.1 tyrosine-type recombinase/integrase [Clostridiales bacterium]
MKIESYKKRGEIRYRFRITLPADNLTGKRKKIQKSGFKSRLEAEKAYVELRGKIPESGKITTLNDIYNAFIKFKRLELKPSSLSKIISIYNHHFKDSLGSMRLDEITSSQLQQIILDLNERYQTANKIYLVVEQIFRFAYKQRLITENPCDFVSKPKKKPKIPTENFYTKDELIDFLTACKRDLSHMWYVFFHLLAYSGIRRGEALALMWSEYDGKGIYIKRTLSEDENKNTIVSETPKTDKSRRYIILDSTTLELLNSLERTCDFIFSNSKGSFITPSQPIRQLHKIKGVKYVTPHGLRHTHCSLLFSAGVSLSEVQQRLGHKDIQTTLQIYNHVYKEDTELALEKFVNFMGQTVGQSSKSGANSD